MKNFEEAGMCFSKTNAANTLDNECLEATHGSTHRRLYVNYKKRPNNEVWHYYPEYKNTRSTNTPKLLFLQ